MSGESLRPKEIEALRQKKMWTPSDKESILKTAMESALASAAARMSAKERDAAQRHAAKLDKQVETLTAEKKTLEDWQFEHANDASSVASLRKEVQELRQDIHIRDTFLRQEDLVHAFKDFCEEVGHRLTVAVQELSQQIRMR